MLKSAIYLFVLLATLPVFAATKTVPISQAIADLQGIKPNQLTFEQQKVYGAKIERAWKTILKAGENALPLLHKEIRNVLAKKKKDDFFMLNVSVLLWRIGKISQAKQIAMLWKYANFFANYKYVFYIAVSAARTGNPAVLPMLGAVLKDRKERLIFSRHGLRVRWPLTHEFVWGIYGPKGNWYLVNVLANSKNADQKISSMLLLSKAQEKSALPYIRKYAKNAKGALQQYAIRCLGEYGDSKDYPFLIRGLTTKNNKLAWYYVYALYEYGAFSAVPHIVPLIKRKNVPLQLEVAATLMHLLTPQSVAALRQYLLEGTDGRMKRYIRSFNSKFLRSSGLSWAQYDAFSLDKKRKVCAQFLKKRDAVFVLQKDDKKLTHSQMVALIKKWKKNGRMNRYSSWVRMRHILSVATPKDITLLLEAKAVFLRRLSDECLYETKRIDKMVRILARRR